MILKSKKVDYNDLFILECYNSNDLSSLKVFNIPSIEDFTMSSRFQYLLKEEYLVEDYNDSNKIIISTKGRDLLEAVSFATVSKSGSIQAVLVFADPDVYFEEWWKTFPTTAKWETDDGLLKFTGSRTLKTLTKKKAKEKYLKLLNQGLAHKDLLGSLKYEIKIKKLDSIKKGVNQLEFFKGMESYFNTERYLVHIDDYRKDPAFVDNVTTNSKSKNVTDI